MTLRFTLAATLFLSVAGTALADTSGQETALEMRSSCRAFEAATFGHGHIAFARTYDSGVCWGAFAAIQALASAQWEDAKDEATILRTCLPPTSRGELIKVFTRYVDTHPERGQETFTNVVFSALWSAYPCPAPPANSRQ